MQAANDVTCESAERLKRSWGPNLLNGKYGNYDQSNNFFFFFFFDQSNNLHPAKADHIREKRKQQGGEGMAYNLESLHANFDFQMINESNT